MKQSELFALNHYLEHFPKNKSIEEIFDLIKDPEDHTVIFKDAYIDSEDDDDDILKIIAMIEEIDKQFFPFHELVTVIDRDTVSDSLTIQLNREPTEDEISRVCSFLDNDFSYQLQEKISDAITYLSIPKEGAV